MDRGPRITQTLKELDRQSLKHLETNKLVLLLAWLNRTMHPDMLVRGEYYSPNALASARIERIFQLLKSFELDVYDGKTGDSDAVESLNNLLRQYTMIFVSTPSGPIDKGRSRIFLESTSESIETVQETKVIQSMVEVFGAGLLNRIVRCVCGRWYFVTKRDHTSCSIGCRKRKYESTPEYKRAKADRVRQKRALREKGENPSPSK